MVRTQCFHCSIPDWGTKIPQATLQGQNNVYTNVVVQSLSHVWLFAIPWTAAHQASLSFTISWSLLKLMPMTSVTPSNHLILCRPLSFCLQSFPASGSFLMSHKTLSSVQLLSHVQLCAYSILEQFRKSHCYIFLDDLRMKWMVVPESSILESKVQGSSSYWYNQTLYNHLLTKHPEI